MYNGVCNHTHPETIIGQHKQQSLAKIYIFFNIQRVCSYLRYNSKINYC